MFTPFCSIPRSAWPRRRRGSVCDTPWHPLPSGAATRDAASACRRGQVVPKPHLSERPTSPHQSKATPRVLGSGRCQGALEGCCRVAPALPLGQMSEIERVMVKDDARIGVRSLRSPRMLGGPPAKVRRALMCVQTRMLHAQTMVPAQCGAGTTSRKAEQGTRTPQL